MHSSMENIYQMSEMLLMENIYVSILIQEWHTPKQLVTSPDIPILSGITPREYLTSCTSEWSRKITLWPTTAKMEIIFHPHPTAANI